MLFPIAINVAHLLFGLMANALALSLTLTFGSHHFHSHSANHISEGTQTHLAKRIIRINRELATTHNLLSNFSQTNQIVAARSWLG